MDDYRYSRNHYSAWYFLGLLQLNIFVSREEHHKADPPNEDYFLHRNFHCRVEHFLPPLYQRTVRRGIKATALFSAGMQQLFNSSWETPLEKRPYRLYLKGQFE